MTITHINKTRSLASISGFSAVVAKEQISQLANATKRCLANDTIKTILQRLLLFFPQCLTANRQ